MDYDGGDENEVLVVGPVSAVLEPVVLVLQLVVVVALSVVVVLIFGYVSTL